MFLTEPLGGVKNLQVTDPTTSSLKVRWEPAEGNVRQYRIFYVPATGGAEDMVRRPTESVKLRMQVITITHDCRCLRSAEEYSRMIEFHDY